MFEEGPTSPPQDIRIIIASKLIVFIYNLLVFGKFNIEFRRWKYFFRCIKILKQHHGRLVELE